MSRLMSDEDEIRSQEWIDRMTDEEIRRIEWDRSLNGLMNDFGSYDRGTQISTIVRYYDTIITDDIILINRVDITSCRNVKGLLWSIIDWAYSSLQETKVSIRATECKLINSPVYDPEYAKDWSDRIRRQREASIKAIEESRAIKDKWEQAITWAREHGANIRRSSRGYNKNTVIVRIYEARLMDEFNKEFPEYKFDKEQVKDAKIYLKEREAYYSGKKNHGRSRR